jgi:osmotically-inducible protein OsmY
MTAAVSVKHTLDHPSEHLVRGLDTVVEGALWNYGPLRAARSLVSVTADADGSVTLSGNVVSRMMKSMAGRIASTVPGVTAVHDQLVTDSAIEEQAAGLLYSQDYRIFTDRLDLESRLGIVYLGGVMGAPDPAVAQAALDTALEQFRGLAGVREVISRVDIVSGGDEFAAMTQPETAVGEAEGGPERAMMEERLRVWRERAAARG